MHVPKRSTHPPDRFLPIHFTCPPTPLSFLGSSTKYPADLGDKGGITLDDPVHNPDFATWNVVYAPYCDGGSWSGEREGAVPVPATATAATAAATATATATAAAIDAPLKAIYFRGRANMRAMVASLLSEGGLDLATDIIIDGGSAGGLTTLLHADYFKSLVVAGHQDGEAAAAASLHYGAIGDAGWFRPDASMDHKNYTGLMHNMFALMNATTHAACEAAQPPTGDRADCAFAPVVFPHMEADMFVLEGGYDSWQVINILGLKCSCE